MEDGKRGLCQWKQRRLGVTIILARGNSVEL